jgi:hypothetical protein
VYEDAAHLVRADGQLIFQALVSGSFLEMPRHCSACTIHLSPRGPEAPLGYRLVGIEMVLWDFPWHSILVKSVR